MMAEYTSPFSDDAAVTLPIRENNPNAKISRIRNMHSLLWDFEI